MCDLESNDKISESLEDVSTIRTANDAILSKVSAVKAGYFEDRYVDRMLLGMKKANGMQSKRSPMINRGYFSRVEVVNILVERFFSAATSSSENNGSGVTQVQILNLGCGFDTLSLNIIEKHGNKVQVFEVDYHSVITKKAFIVENDSHLRQPIADSCHHHDEHHTIEIENCSYGHKIGNLHFIAADLRDDTNVCTKLHDAGFNTHIPTIVLTECVLVYLDKSKVEKLISSVSHMISKGIWISYDMTNPCDVFGRMMHRNLTEAGYHIPGFTDFPTLTDLSTRFEHSRWESSCARTMLDLHHHLIPSAEHHRIARLEIFDEVEEWNMLMEHYAMTVSTKGPEFAGILG